MREFTTNTVRIRNNIFGQILSTSSARVSECTPNRCDRALLLRLVQVHARLDAPMQCVWWSEGIPDEPASDANLPIEKKPVAAAAAEPFLTSTDSVGFGRAH
jgi:hypothetical protein